MWFESYELRFSRNFSPSTFRICCLGCGSNKLCLGNSPGVEVSLHLHPCIIVGVLSYVLIFYFIIWLLKGSLESFQSTRTIFSSTWCHTKGGSCFYFVAQSVSIGTKKWCMENGLWNWPSTVVLSGWSSPFFGCN